MVRLVWIISTGMPRLSKLTEAIVWILLLASTIKARKQVRLRLLKQMVSNSMILKLLGTRVTMIKLLLKAKLLSLKMQISNNSAFHRNNFYSEVTLGRSVISM